MYRIGIDIGGTFTDLAAVDDAGRVVIAKSASTPARSVRRPARGAHRARRRAGHRSRRRCSTQTERIVHGTTAATNALLERKGATRRRS